ncbi:MAG: hypothetical protein ACOH2L_09585 [Devosia sp.]
MSTQDDKPAVSAISVQEMIDLVVALASLIAEENEMLRCGAPASLVGTVKLKVKLAGELERHIALMRAGGVFEGDADPELRARLVQRGAELQMAMQENASHLRAAMISTRRRVDAIMRAFREHEARPGRYDNSGRRTLTLASTMGAGRTV